ncbi:hypothetical protein JW935_22770 [candidate division KSB1 bacterium]|nr:hypothetical protein [candidate division KSB1 bacterium]
MRKRSSLLFLLLFYHVLAWGQADLCDSRIIYEIKAIFDPETGIISGSQNIDWTNSSSDAVREVYFHADLNAFRNNHSAYYRASLDHRAVDAWQLDAEHQAEQNWGYMKIKSVKLGEQSLEPAFEHDYTVFKVSLPSGILPGRSVKLFLNFEAKLPYDGPGLGFKEKNFVAARWYPRLGVWKNGKWSCDPFFLHCGLYSRLANYRVELTVPDDYQVAATGVLSDSSATGELKTLTFTQECVTDFCWAASSEMTCVKRDFTHSELPTVQVNIFQFGKRQTNVTKLFEAASQALIHFGLWYTPYPYSQLTIIDGPLSSAGTHVLPLFVLIGDRKKNAPRQFDSQYQIVSQVARQFWSVMMSCDQDRWFGSGMSEYSTQRCMNAVFGARLYSTGFLRHNGFEIPFAYNNSQIFQWTFNPYIWDFREQISDLPLSAQREDPVNPADLDANFSEKSALAFWTLEATLGEEVFGKAIRSFALENSFKNPSLSDFFSSLAAYTDRELDWFFHRLAEGKGYVDFAVENIRSFEAVNTVGFAENDDFKYQPPEETGGKPKLFESIIELSCTGDIGITVDIRMTMENGEEINETWDGLSQYKLIRLSHDSRITLVEIDPQNKVYLDVFKNNNSMYRNVNPVPALKWTTRWLFWLQHFFEVVAFFS